MCENKPNGDYQHPSKCSKFVKCSNGMESVMECPGDLVFNPTTDQCDYKENTMCQVWNAVVGNWKLFLFLFFEVFNLKKEQCKSPTINFINYQLTSKRYDFHSLRMVWLFISRRKLYSPSFCKQNPIPLNLFALSSLLPSPIWKSMFFDWLIDWFIS